MQITETIQCDDAPLPKLPKAQQNLVWTLTSSVTNILASLSEAQEEIAEAISNSSSIIRFLCSTVSFTITPHDVQNEALSCLATLSEDNKILGAELVGNKEWLGRIVAIKDAEDLNAVTACGLLHNIFTSLQWYDHNTPVEGLSDAALIPVLVGSIETMAGARSNGSNGHPKHSSPDQVLQLALEITASIATSLQEALEHGSKHEKPFEGFDITDDVLDEDVMDHDDDDVPEDDEESEEEEMTQEDIDADMELVLGDDQDEDVGPIEEITLDRLVRNSAPAILQLARLSLQNSSANGPIPGLALSALNNIAWTVSSIDFSTRHLDSLFKFWSKLVQDIWTDIISPVLASNTADIDLASSITSLAWAVARSVQGAVKVKSEEHRKFMSLYQASKTLPVPSPNGNKKTQDNDNDAFQSLGVKSIGVLGRLALDPAPIQLNREIGVFLITILAAPDTPAADAVEALNQIFDIYADKSFTCDEAVFWADGFYKHLEEILPKTKKMAKSIDKRKFTELRARADEAILNLGRFLKYKRTEKQQED